MKFNPSRLILARKRNLLNKKEFAERAGVNQKSASRWECGDYSFEPSKENVVEFSRVLGYPVEFFYGPTPDEPVAETTSFRSQTSMTALIRDASLAAGSLGFMVSDWVDEKFALPPVHVPDLRHYDPEQAARVLREEWQIGERPVSHMLNILEAKGIRVFSLSENTASVDAYSLWRNGIPYIFLNNFKTAERSRFDAAHELGHLALHQDGSPKGRSAEDQANAFASSFLMPRADVLAHLPRVMHLGELVEAKRRWKVSLAALAYRCHKLGIISDWKYRDFCIQIRQRYNKTEPNGIEREVSRSWKMILNQLWSEGVSQKKIADDLQIPEQELHGLVFSIVEKDHQNEITPFPLTEVADAQALGA